MRTESVILIIFTLAIIAMACIFLLVALFALGDKNSDQSPSYWLNHQQGQEQQRIRWLPVLVSLFTIVGAVAALFQVPEVRIFLGLDPPPVKQKNKSVQGQQPDVYSIRVFNCDDECRALINGTLIVKTGFGEDTGWVDISNKLKSKGNTIRFQVVNTTGAITYGFQVRKNTPTIFEQICGTARVSGCEDNRQDFPTGLARSFTFALP